MIIFYTLSILSILFFIGYGFTALFLPDKLRKDSFFIIFWLGIIFSVVLGVALTMARIPLRYGKYVILSLSLFLLLYSMIKKKSIFHFSKETLLISLFMLISLFFNLYPLIAKSNFPTRTPLSNLDNFVSYVNAGEYLINHSLIDDRIELDAYLKPYSKSVNDLLYYDFRWGGPVLLGFISDTLEVKTYQIYYILTAIFFVLIFPLIFVVSKNFLKVEKKYLLPVILLIFVMNSTLHYSLYNVFFAQLILTGILVLLLLFLLNYFLKKKNFSNNFNSYDFLIAIAISSISSVYWEGIMFICFSLVIFFIIKLFNKERLSMLRPLLKIMLLSILINPVTFGLASKLSFDFFFK